ncbi:hypothetical protein PHYPSEUDO_002778 [Phytophthora pseudosyringae]|uniref:RxLR effector protein n=1 Tax=Phytophthora pseudosyringae TaxID=221518 RepID=A0A8T1VWI3_9STRA|nr:hypothetical protein PHYPSEUDO_002778 [Phytophthora pseudosyringae]
MELRLDEKQVVREHDLEDTRRQTPFGIVPLLVLAAAFLASSDAARDSKITAFGLPALVRLISTDRTRILPERFLRTENRADTNDGERGISLKSIPGLKKLTGLFKTKITPGTLVNWANKQESLDYVFLKLKLDKAGTQLFDYPDINMWAAYASAVVKTNPEAAMLTSLQARYTDDVLSTMLEAGKG